MTNINNIEVFNIVTVFVMLILMFKIKNMFKLLAVLFLYGSLHFSFGVFPLFSNESTELLKKLHIEGGGMLANVSAVLLFVSVLYVLSKDSLSLYKPLMLNAKSIPTQILAVMIIIAIGYLFNYRSGDWLQLKNVIFVEAMLGFLFIGFISITCENKNCLDIFYSWAIAGILLLVFITAIAFYEVFSHKSWAGTLESSGIMVYRASATLFNPNLLAFWASLSYLVCAYLSVKTDRYKTLMLAGMILTSILIYLSGSRTVAYLLMLVLLVPVLIDKSKFDYKGLLTLPITILVIYALSAFFSKYYVYSFELLNLGNRFAVAPLYLLNYIFNIFGISYRFDIGIPSEVVISIEGRFSSDLRDSGWLVLYQDVGLIGMLPIAFYCFILIKKGIVICKDSKDISHAYILSLFLISILIGIVMRFQIYPVWLFIGVTVILYLVFLEKKTINPVKAII